MSSLACSAWKVLCLLAVATGDLRAARNTRGVPKLQASRITGSPPLLSELDILCEMEHEGLREECLLITDLHAEVAIFVDFHMGLDGRTFPRWKQSLKGFGFLLLLI